MSAERNAELLRGVESLLRRSLRHGLLRAESEAMLTEIESALATRQHRYAAPFKMFGKPEEWVQVRFVPRDQIKDKPTEANPSPIRVILLGDLERAQPHALANSPIGTSDGKDS